MRRGVLSIALALSLAACGPVVAADQLPRAAELGPGFENAEGAPEIDAARPAARRAALESLCARAGVPADDGIDAVRMLTGGADTPSLDAPFAWTTAADGPESDRVRRSYVHESANGRLTVDATLVSVAAAADLDALGAGRPSEREFAKALATFADLIAARAASPDADRAAELDVVEALASDPARVPAAIRAVAARRELETVVRGRMLDIGHGGHVVVTASRSAGIVRDAAGFGRVRVGRAALLFEVEAAGPRAATLLDDLPGLAARLASRLAVYGGAR